MVASVAASARVILAVKHSLLYLFSAITWSAIDLTVRAIILVWKTDKSGVIVLCITTDHKTRELLAGSRAIVDWVILVDN